ncbi:MAG TPA: hypothetical protein VH598_11565, partial [Verrucomicrobiae bacterium]|nr:hypothetical protein [Verrucomicrobiae bacterium]
RKLMNDLVTRFKEYPPRKTAKKNLVARVTVRLSNRQIKEVARMGKLKKRRLAAVLRQHLDASIADLKAKTPERRRPRVAA